MPDCKVTVTPLPKFGAGNFNRQALVDVVAATLIGSSNYIKTRFRAAAFEMMISLHKEGLGMNSSVPDILVYVMIPRVLTMAVTSHYVIAGSLKNRR